MTIWFGWDVIVQFCVGIDCQYTHIKGRQLVITITIINDDQKRKHFRFLASPKY